MRPGRLRRALTRLFEIGAVLTALFTIATAFDSLHQFLELFSHFRLQYFLVSLLLAVLLFALNRRPYGLVMLAMAVVNAAYVVPWYLGDTPRDNGATLTILHSNIFASNRDASRLLEQIEAERPDIVFVQELTEAHSEILAVLGEQYSHMVLAPRSGSFGIGVWSTIPFVDSEVFETTPLELPNLRLVIEFDGRELTLFSTHPVPPMGREWYEYRNTQLGILGQAITGTSGSVALVGDLNISMWANHYRKLGETTGLRNARKGHGIAPSWPTFLPIGMIPIDHVLLDDGLQAIEFRTLPSVGSDHLPVLVKIQRRKKR